MEMVVVESDSIYASEINSYLEKGWKVKDFKIDSSNSKAWFVIYKEDKE